MCNTYNRSATEIAKEASRKKWQNMSLAAAVLDERSNTSRALDCLLYVMAYGDYPVYLFMALSALYFMLSVAEWCQTWEELWVTNNPKEFNKPGYLRTHLNVDRLSGFERHELFFKRVGPPQETWRMRLGCIWLRWKGYDVRPTRDLCVWLCIPQDLLEKSKNEVDEEFRVGIFVNIGGGGMVTGHPMDPVWTPQAVIDGAIKHHSVYVAIDRRRMPESNCESIEKDNEDAMRFLFEGNQLQECVQSKYPNIRLDFEKVIIRAESAGARFGLDAWRLYGHRVAAIVCFYGLFRSYSRQPGVYMDKEVSFEEAETSMLKSERLRMRLRGEIPPAIGRATPIFQYAAYYLSVTDVWQDVWDGKSAMDCLDEMSDCPNENTIMLFTHGSADELVSLSSSQEMVKKLKKKWPRLDVKLQSLEGVGHGFDYDDPLHSVRMVGLRDLLEKIFK